MLTYSSLPGALAAERERALREKARTAWQRRRRGEVQIRAAADADASSLLRLARLDSSRPVSGAVLVAVEEGEIVAALSLERGAVVADPFRPTAALVDMLRLRADQLRGDPPRPRRALWGLRPRPMGA